MNLGQGRIAQEYTVDIYAQVYKALTAMSPKYARLLLPPVNTQVLGYGMLGHVYTTRNPDRVLKLTADASELIMGKWFEARRRRKAYRGVVQVYDARLVPLGRAFTRRFRNAPPEEYDPADYVHVTGRRRRGFKLREWTYHALPVTLPTHIIALLREPIIATEGEISEAEYRKQFARMGYQFGNKKWQRAAEKLDDFSEAAQILRASLEPDDEDAPAPSLVEEVRGWLKRNAKVGGIGWLAESFLALHDEGIGISDLHEGNLGVTARSYKAGQFVLFDFGIAYSSHPMRLPEELEGWV